MGGLVTTPTGALATTGPAGGREAIAGAAGGGMTAVEACLGCGMITRRGSGGLGAAGSADAAGAAGLAAMGGAACGGRTGKCGRRDSSSSSFFLARMAFITSPGLETLERSIFGVMAWVPRDADPECADDRVPRSKCARTFSASSRSSELEWVFPSASPSSANISRTCRLLTSISRARSLIRTLLIRLFSEVIPKPVSCS